MIQDIYDLIYPYLNIVQIILILIVTFIIFSIFLKIIEKRLLRKVRTQQQASNVTAFISLLRFIFVFILVIIAFSFYYGQSGEIGFIAGLITIALGWALQKPISGIVAWIVLVSRRPIHIGDRVIISDMKGDIKNITLTHIILDEVGGTIDGEENSGRRVMIPTSIIFEEEVINYTQQDEYILDEVLTSITYESNLDLAEKIIINTVKKIMKPYWEKFPKRFSREPHTRLKFTDSGVDIKVRYNTFAKKRNLITTNITREIWRQFKDNSEVDFAYPHTEILLRKK
jgi:small-conductance mechanosensitive channel